MTLSAITLDAVQSALAEADRLGRAAFLRTHGFSRATTYVLRHGGKFYDPKAVIGVAHGYASGTPLRPNEFDATEAIARLENLRFEVLPFSGLWWVNQGASYQPERDGGYVWAPTQTRSGFGVGHHTAVNELRVGQRIIHYANGYVRAISQVADAPRVAPRPAELSAEAWGDQGFLCPVDYQELPEPISRFDIPGRDPAAGPFAINGKVKQGYLFKVHDDYVFPLLEFLNARNPTLFDHATTHPHLPDPEPPRMINVGDDPLLDTVVLFKNVVLEGVPGTGKSFAIERIARAWQARTGRPLLTFDGRPYTAMVLHPSSSYEDFVEGLRPVMATAAHPPAFDDDVTADTAFGIRNGFFVRACIAAVRAPDKDVLVLLDELNRCNIPSVFGDLLLTLEASRRAHVRGSISTPPHAGDWTVATPATLPYSGRTFFVPDNVYIIATTNTTDRSVAPLDAALRRRFAFHRLEPDIPTADILHADTPIPVRDLFATTAQVLRNLNERVLRPCLGPDAMLGHSYLYAAAAALADEPSVEHAITQLKAQWQYAVLPQLIDTVRSVGAEDLLDPQAREHWFTDHPELAHDQANARPALSQLDHFLREAFELTVIVRGTGLTRGAQIEHHRPTMSTDPDPDPDPGVREPGPPPPGTDDPSTDDVGTDDVGADELAGEIDDDQPAQP